MKYLVSLFFILMTNIALACTPGAGNGPTGDPNCMAGVLANQPQGNSGRGRTIVRTIYYDNWGAIVSDNRTGQLFFSDHYPTQKAAIDAALKKCGAKTCVYDGSYANSMLVLTTGQKSNGIWVLGMGVDDDISKAQAESFADCKKRGGLNCYIVAIQDSR